MLTFICLLAGLIICFWAGRAIWRTPQEIRDYRRLCAAEAAALRQEYGRRVCVQDETERGLQMMAISDAEYDAECGGGFHWIATFIYGGIPFLIGLGLVTFAIYR